MHVCARERERERGGDRRERGRMTIRLTEEDSQRKGEKRSTLLKTIPTINLDAVRDLIGIPAN